MPLSQQAQGDLQWALNAFRWRRYEQFLYRDYMAGNHRFTLATLQYRAAFRELLRGLRLNVCPSVIHAVTDRLKLVGFEGNDSETDTAAAAAAWQLWQDGRLDRHANQIHSESLVSGDAYLIVWPDPDGSGKVCFHPNQGIDCTVRYDPEDHTTIQVAAKLWDAGGYARMNLYYPDRIEKYITSGRIYPQAADPGSSSVAVVTFLSESSIPASAQTFEPFEVPDEPWPLPNPYDQVPVFHFAYDAGLGQFGVSELRDVIPLQDAINKELSDLVVASEFGAFRQRWVIGMEPQGYDANGDPIMPALKTGVDRLLALAAPDAKFGEFEATDLNNFLGTISALMTNVAQIKGIPLHQLLMTGTFPSGESQKTAESRLVSKVQDLQTDFGDVWEDAMQFALRIAGIEGAAITAKWADAQSRAELEHVQSVATKVTAIGIPQTQAWRELEYSDDQIAQMQAEKAEQAASATEAFNSAFNRGPDFGQPA